jgi:23S rRNA pseudouridine2605 synthase
MRDRPHPNHKLEWPGGVVPEWARPKQGGRKRFGKGGKGERQGGSSPSKRERLQKVMAQSGHGSRRNIEILIAQGHITINGQVAKLGDAVGPGDKVKLDGNPIQLRFGAERPRVLMYHKPEGEIVTRDDPEKRPTVFDKLPKVNGGRWVSVGRLDLNTGGLLLFTTSGDLANKLTHPRFEVEREYAVRVMGEITEELRERLLKTGVEIDGELCTFDSIDDRGGEGSNRWYHVVLREGKNREVRRMMEGVGLMVSRLMRVRFGPIELPGFLKRGMMREMDEDSVIDLLTFAGANDPPPAEAAAEDVEDEHDNVGNRIDPRQARREEPEIDDDMGNRIMKAAPERDEPDGNRGTYNPNAGDRPPKPGPGEGNRRSQGGGGGKPFFKKRGSGHGGQGQGQGRGDDRGNQAPRAQQHGRGQRQPQGGRPQGHPQGQPQGQPQGEPQGQPAGPPQGQGQPGSGQPKPGRHRNRNRNRNRNRGGGGGGGGGAGGGGAGGGGNHEARGEQQPQDNGNREPR